MAGLERRNFSSWVVLSEKGGAAYRTAYLVIAEAEVQ